LNETAWTRVRRVLLRLGNPVDPGAGDRISIGAVDLDPGPMTFPDGMDLQL